MLRYHHIKFSFSLRWSGTSPTGDISSICWDFMATTPFWVNCSNLLRSILPTFLLTDPVTMPKSGTNFEKTPHTLRNKLITYTVLGCSMFCIALDVTSSRSKCLCRIECHLSWRGLWKACTSWVINVQENFQGDSIQIGHCRCALQVILKMWRHFYCRWVHAAAWHKYDDVQSLLGSARTTPKAWLQSILSKETMVGNKQRKTTVSSFHFWLEIALTFGNDAKYCCSYYGVTTLVHLMYRLQVIYCPSAPFSIVDKKCKLRNISLSQVELWPSLRSAPN